MQPITVTDFLTATGGWAINFEAEPFCVENAEPMDSVLIAGKGHENVQIIGEERRAFDDVQVSGEILQHMAIRQLAQTG